MYQQQGQICLVFSQAYHCGFNMGYNIAEAVNYGSKDWPEKYLKFRGCRCVKEIGVHLEEQDFLENIKKNGNL